MQLQKNQMAGYGSHTPKWTPEDLAWTINLKGGKAFRIRLLHKQQRL